MSDAINLLNNVSQLDVSPLANGYTKVIINAGTDENGNVIAYQSGSDGGAVLTIDNPWGTQTMADNMLAQLSGYQYQPYSASGAILDPSAELGDGVTIAGTYGGLFSKTTSFTSLMKSDISAPGSEEIEHEQTSAVESATDRAYSRLVKSVASRISQTANQILLETQARTSADESLTAQLNVQASEISARVSKDGGSSSGVGWYLHSDRWEIKANDTTILKVTASGLEVNGKITATSGKIGGFTIQSDYLTYGGQTWGGASNSGIYIGTSGIQLGNSVKISSSGSMELSGTLKLGGKNITANNLRTGAVGGNSYNGCISDSSHGGKVYTQNHISAKYITWNNNDLKTQSLSAYGIPFTVVVI